MYSAAYATNYVIWLFVSLLMPMRTQLHNQFIYMCVLMEGVRRFEEFYCAYITACAIAVELVAVHTNTDMWILRMHLANEVGCGATRVPHLVYIRLFTTNKGAQ